MRAPTTNISKQDPALYRAAVDMSLSADAAAIDAGFSPPFVEAIKIRVSQLNGCAFCLRAHTRDALVKGETAERLAVLPAWRETAYFTDVERAALSLAESVTRMGEGPERVSRQHELAELTPAQYASVAWVAITINAFNRIAVTSHYVVAPAA